MAFGESKPVEVKQNLCVRRFLCEILILFHGHEQYKAHRI